MSSRSLQDMSWRHLEDVFSVTIFRLPRLLYDVLEDVKLLPWTRIEDVFKTSQQMFAGISPFLLNFYFY